ncbi:MAG: GMP synthase [Candidatus Bathyarchaeota archaeon]|nr:MAG: GMP synthase [Candidatus Bathyarchaeota archaeon]
MQEFDQENFVHEQVEKTKELVGKHKALVAVSGGVDSTASAVVVHRAIGSNLLCVMLDDAFMREGEPERIAEILEEDPLTLPVKVLNVQERFLKALEGLKDAEEKRMMFRETFYKVLGETAKKEGCKVLVQGTIKADVIETTGGIKTQHNVLDQMGINTVDRYGFKVVEPLVSLYKEEVRKVARYLKIPPEISERQPFPGPGLSVRVVGEIKRDKLSSEKKATAIVEENFAKHNPSQYLAAILDNQTTNSSQHTHNRAKAAHLLNVPSSQVSFKVLQSKATGVVKGKRRYGKIGVLGAQRRNGTSHSPSISSLVALQTKIITQDLSFSRIFYTLKERAEKQPYVVVLRAIDTHDFLTAKVSEIPWKTLEETAERILESCSNVASVYYDVTPKPPATIEME